MITKKKVFITGECGCIAKYLDRILPNEGYEVVWGYTHRESRWCFFSSMWKNGTELDICDKELLDSRIEKTHPDIVIHTAGVVDTFLCEQFPEQSVRSNVYGSYNVATICRDRNIQLVYFSTTAIYDPNDYDGKKITLNTKIAPQTIYGVTKYAGEQICKNIVKNLIVLRPCFVYGGSDDMHSSIARLIRTSITHVPVRILLSPTIQKDYMRVEDLISAIVKIMDWGLPGEYNISRGTPVPFRKVIDTIQEVLQEGLWYDLVPEADYLKNHIVDNAKIRSLGWESKYSLLEGIQRSVREFNESRLG
jgi:nucleoside-diphosphate-sugar epimerase